MPAIAPAVTGLLTNSSIAAAQSCSGGDNGQTCGAKWYVDGYDGNYGLGQQLSALETVQSLLLLQSPIAPIHESAVDIQAQPPTSTFTVAPRTATPSVITPSTAKSFAVADFHDRAASTALQAYVALFLALLAFKGVLSFRR